MNQKYCLDTSFFINSWVKHYRQQVFPSFWRAIDQLIRRKVVFSCDEVYYEIKRRDDDLLAWVEDRRQIFFEADDDTIIEMKKVMLRFPNFVAAGSSRNSADPWLIAHAIQNGGIVVTDEQPIVGLPRDTKPPKKFQTSATHLA